MKYKCFGLIIDTPFPLQRMPCIPETVAADVEIQIGDAGVDIDIANHPKTIFYGKDRAFWTCLVSCNRMLFNCYAGIFDIIEGKKMVINPSPSATQEQIQTFILGSGMGGIQTQIDRTLLHGGAVVSKQGAVVITGESGAGKSTMVSALVHLGYKYLTDDVSAVIFDCASTPVIVPAFPQRKLVGDACDALHDRGDNLVMVDMQRDKYAISDHAHWCDAPVQFSTLVELIPTHGIREIELKTISGVAKLRYLIKGLYRRWMLCPGGVIEPQVMKKLLSIAASIDIQTVYMPHDIGNVMGTAQQICAGLGLSL